MIMVKKERMKKSEVKHEEDHGGDVNHLLADLASRNPTGIGDRPEKKDVEYNGNDQLQDDDAELEQFTEAELELADLGSHIDAQSYKSNRHPNHSSEDEKTKLGHFLLAFQHNFLCVLSLKRFGAD